MEKHAVILSILLLLLLLLECSDNDRVPDSPLVARVMFVIFYIDVGNIAEYQTSRKAHAKHSSFNDRDTKTCVIETP